MSRNSGTDLEIVAFLKILGQKSIAEQVCPIYPGDNIIGRASNSAVVISDKTVSKKHACVLVEGGEHFVKDCSSKNKTYRRSAELRPEAYYELRNDLELTFGEVKCQYLVGTSADLPESMDVDATVPYAVDDVVSVDSRDATPDLTATSRRSMQEGQEERDRQTENESTEASRPSENHGQTLPFSHTVRDANDDNSPPASPQLLGSPSILSPPTAAESSDSPAERERAAVPQERLEDATPFKQTLLLEDETPDTCMATKTPNTTDPGNDTLLNASTVDYSTTDPATSRDEHTSHQGLKEAEVRETVPYSNHGAVAPTVPYSANEDIEPTVPYPQGGMLDPTVPYGAESAGGPAEEVEPTVPYNLCDEETDIESEGDCGGDGVGAKVPPERFQTSQESNTSAPATPTLTPTLNPTATPTPAPALTPTSTPGRRGKGRACKVGTPTKVEAGGSDYPCVLFTGVTDDDAQKVVSSLGGKMAASVYECTHLVTDKMRRTVKFLCCLARGCHIVNFKWVDKCRTQQRFVDPSSFVVKDRAFEKQHGFTLTESRKKALSNPGGVLAGYSFVLSPQVKPDHEQLGDIIKCTGGCVVNAAPVTLTDRCLILSAEEDASMFAEEERKGYPVYSTEFLFAAVLKQELELSSHRLACSGGREERKVASRKRSADTKTSSRSKRKPKR